MAHDWLTIHEGAAPLVIGLPHTGTDIPAAIEARMTSPWLARKDADWWVDRLYDFAADMGATLVRTAISRSVIDVNRDPSGASLYPGMTTTGLCPTETFDGEPLYLPGQTPDEAEIAERRATWFDPYHAALQTQIDRLRATGPVVLYDAHSIRSIVPRLFAGELPQFNIGDNGGTTCSPDLSRAVEAACAVSGQTLVLNGRFKGGWTTRHYGQPHPPQAADRRAGGDRQTKHAVHAIQMELADRGYMLDPAGPVSEANWPSPYDPERAEPMRGHLRRVLGACIAFAESQR
ncbi:N-formylglutamate deformylase [Brevundimonas sp. Leaf363]|uniref:N-formylglutamate deformylase n=1 Tax=Brevundimonas sp. Leaf363 TaxID=1736353 RepID=UPI000701F83A|nr:N-formylglutamate deformylase [Brevundimonas sp. Leaf363]KQS54300.1 N-formylglutamate deformylase [Brevundimonas sp. Leaf363]